MWGSGFRFEGWGFGVPACWLPGACLSSYTSHTAGYEGVFGGLATESRLRYPYEPPYVPTLLPTVGPVDRLDGLFKKTFEVRCVDTW